MKISQDILEVLERCTIQDNTLFLPDEQLDRAMYTKVNKCLENIGGKWNRKAKGHLFDHDPTDGLENMITTGETTDFKKVFQFFPTPRAVAGQMCKLAELDEDSKVLEPSIGKGDLADVVCEQGIMQLVGVEINKDMGKYLREKPYKSLVGVDFLTLAYDPSREDLLGCKKFTHVIMNPPFAKQQDLDHIRAAYEMLKPGGILVSVATTSWQWRKNKKTMEFRKWLSGLDYRVIEVPPGAFKESGTMIATVILKIHRK
ncbi:MAG: class I SAM-dependent methyltransferase [Defluviitaleaceae bacterium]|nr:class I SAM-dependent methyltransferase [Defluviitaleaceae bacterium]